MGKNAITTKADTTEKQMDRLNENGSKHSSQISDLSQKIGFSLVGLPFALMFERNNSQSSFFDHWRIWLMIIALLGVLTILADYLHHFFAVKAYEKAKTVENYVFDTDGSFFKLGNFMRNAKQAFAFFGSIIVMFIIAIEIFRFPFCKVLL